MRRTATALLALISLLLLSGCFKVDMDLTVNSDETVDGTMIVAVDEEMYAMMSGDDDAELFGTDDMPEGSEVEEYEADGLKGQKVTFTDVPLSELQESVGEDEGEFSLTHEGDEFVFSMSVDPEDMGGSEGDTGTSDSTDQEFEESMDAMMQQMMEDAEVRVAITFPGGIKESNGAVQGNTVTWDVDLTEKSEMRAVAADEDTSSVIVYASLGALVLLMLAVGGWLLLRRRIGGAEESSSDDGHVPVTD